MALHSGIDTIAIVSFGVYTETYDSEKPGNRANLFASRGFLEDIGISPQTFVIKHFVNVKRKMKMLPNMGFTHEL